MKKIKLLQSVSLFWDLTEEELGYISEKMVSKHYDAGQIILLEASEGEQCFFVTEGSVKITRLSKKGREVILAILSDGDFLVKCHSWMVNSVLQMWWHLMIRKF